jgi:ribosomal-protein-alanine N-acetyltransferase
VRDAKLGNKDGGTGACAAGPGGRDAARRAPSGTAVVLIRPAEEADLDGLHRVDRLVFGRLAYPFFALRQLMDLHARHCVVADDGHQLVGYCLGALAARPRTGWLLGLAVLPGAREAGHGRELVHETVRRIVADGAREVRLAVEPENSGAIHLYETVGFRICGFRPDYFGPEGDRLIMTARPGRLDAPPPRGDRLDTWWD